MVDCGRGLWLASVAGAVFALCKRLAVGEEDRLFFSTAD